MRNLFLAAILAVSPAIALADTPPDAPDQGESFAHFFARITSANNKYPGITFDASEAFQDIFLPRFKENAWVGDKDAIEREVTAHGVNLWFDWYRTETPFSLTVPGRQNLAAFTADFETARAQDCPACRTLAKLSDTPWNQWAVPERAIFAKTYVLRSKIFGGRRIVDLVADNFGYDADAALKALTVQILAHNDFITAVRKIGWNGDVYFRGITTEIPNQPGKLIILLDGDYLRDKTENTQPLFQMLEYAGILTHELNHVFQDLDAAKLGMDLSISSPEGALLIEGHAECMAEEALTRAGRALGDGSATALSLYETQQALGLMDKDAGEHYEFFPYKVGLPFVYSVMHLKTQATSAEIRLGIYRTILRQKTLSELVSDLK